MKNVSRKRRYILRTGAATLTTGLTGLLENTESSLLTPMRPSSGRNQQTLVETGQDWITGSFAGTRLTESGKLILEAYPIATDDFTWSDPAESQFDWQVGTRNGGKLEIASSENQILLNTNQRHDLVELTSTLQADFNTHPKWALEFTAESTNPSNTNTQEFFFLNGGGQGDVDYFMMYDMGGASETNPNPEDGCGDRGKSPFNRDQLSSRDDTNDTQCWDGFTDRPIDWSHKWHGELRADYSSGKIKAYHNNKLQADLQESDGQPMPPQSSYRVWVKNHNKGGDSDLILHDMALRRVGEYQKSGKFMGVVDAGQPIKWTDVEVIGDFPTGTDYDMKYTPANAANVNKTNCINKVQRTQYIKYILTLTTEIKSKTPSVDEIRFIHGTSPRRTATSPRRTIHGSCGISR